MSIALVVNGVSYDYPEEGDQNWGEQATLWAQAVTDSMLQKTGGSFTLSAEVDFGGTAGLKALYFKDRSANPSLTGDVRLGAGGTLSWRNNANSADLALSIDSNDNIQFAGVPISATQIVKTEVGTTYTVLASDLGKMVTLNNAAAIALSVNTGLGLEAGDQIDILQLGAGQVTVGGTATVNGTPGVKLRSQYSAATIYCVGTDSYVILGDMEA